MILECAMVSLSLFFKNSPFFGYRMVTPEGMVMNIDIRGEPDRRSLSQQRVQFEKDTVKRFIDCYQDAVKLIIKLYLKEARSLGISHHELYDIGMDAIIDGILGYKPLVHKDMDSAVYAEIHRAIGEKMRTKAMKTAA